MCKGIEIDKKLWFWCVVNYGVIFVLIFIDNVMDDDRKEELIVVIIYRNKN